MIRSIRARVTLLFSLALLLAVLVFAGGIWIGRKDSAYYRELQRYVQSQAELAIRIIMQAESRGPVTVLRDSLVGPQLTADLASAMEVIPDYLLVLDSTGRAVYVSEKARALPADDLTALQESALDIVPGTTATLLTLRSDQIFLSARLETDERTPIARIVAGSSTSTTEELWRDLLRSMLMLAPVVLLLGGTAAYLIGGVAVRPITTIIRELEAITDGRSLHRRLGGADVQGDELARLASTLNAMIGRLENSFGGLRRFTADASHELKTPLTVLRASIERAMMAKRGSNEQMEYLEEALNEVTRMADLVNSLLSLARADEGRFDLVRDVVLLDSMLRDIAETATILGEPNGIEVIVSECEPLTVEGDAPRLRQLLLNLVENAIKYTTVGGTVELSLSAEQGAAVLTVKDTGMGIAAADLPFIFERFWRADRARSRTSGRGGTGLGLAISQYIAQAHGGTLTAQSRLGRGSTFTLTLPGAVRRDPSRIDPGPAADASPPRVA
ncbi:MAG: HAMP domain-containing sensor histidine kinase [Gemmatimonadaceae bacterium]|nr:HAMP domain-containing sensor histidine kinase [Gemmatimonadaceae bacterium]